MITSPFGWAGPHGGSTEWVVFACKIARYSAFLVPPPPRFRVSAVLDSCPADGVGAVVFALSFFGAWFGGVVATGRPATMSPSPPPPRTGGPARGWEYRGSLASRGVAQQPSLPFSLSASRDLPGLSG